MWRQWLVLAVLVCLKTRGIAKATNVVDCTKDYHQSVSLNGLDFSFTSLLDNDVGPNGYLRVRIVYQGLNWLGFGVSAGGSMYPGFVTIGQPKLQSNVTNPAVYETSGHGVQFVNMLSLNRQTLLNSSVVQNSTHTTLSFTKRMLEFGQYPIHGNGTNRFIYAVGFKNPLAKHNFAGKLYVNLTACVNGAPVLPTLAPSPLPAATSSPTSSQTQSAATFYTSGPTSVITSTPTLGLFIAAAVATTANPSTSSTSKHTSAPQPSPLAVVPSAPVQVPITAIPSPTTSQNISKPTPSTNTTASVGGASASSLQSSATSSFSKTVVLALLWTPAIVATLCFV